MIILSLMLKIVRYSSANVLAPPAKSRAIGSNSTENDECCVRYSLFPLLISFNANFFQLQLKDMLSFADGRRRTLMGTLFELELQFAADSSKSLLVERLSVKQSWVSKQIFVL